MKSQVFSDILYLEEVLLSLLELNSWPLLNPILKSFASNIYKVIKSGSHSNSADKEHPTVNKNCK